MTEPLQDLAIGDSPAAIELKDVIVEFGRHLDMLADQLATSLNEADRQCVSVGASFDDLAAANDALGELDCAEPERSLLQESSRRIGDSLIAAVIALQYHDRLAQRLSLVRVGLDRLQKLLHDQAPRSYNDWLRSLRDVECVNRAEQGRLEPEFSDGERTGAPSINESQSSIELF